MSLQSLNIIPKLDHHLMLFFKSICNLVTKSLMPRDIILHSLVHPVNPFYSVFLFYPYCLLLRYVRKELSLQFS